MGQHMNPAIKNTTAVLMKGGTVCGTGCFAPPWLDALKRRCDALALGRRG